MLHNALYYPRLDPHGNMVAPMFSRSPSGGSESMQLMYMMAITSARSSLHLSSSYFVPDRVNTFAKH